MAIGVPYLHQESLLGLMRYHTSMALTHPHIHTVASTHAYVGPSQLVLELFFVPKRRSVDFLSRIECNRTASMVNLILVEEDV